ncbi:hypothetical protein NHG40_16020 [Bacillus thuringiensis]|uniref:hypothetical protein n=1 Tax=Bacillus thuringiensis TaxID=1428 RepID=UPI002157B998|nr:hypothetical protein [Bacillus thuringiensis]MCR6835423.1 hypothetical protein [Bacillus thuringiensis]
MKQATHDIANKQVERTAVANGSRTVDLTLVQAPPVDYMALSMDMEIIPEQTHETYLKNKRACHLKRYTQIATPEEVQKANVFVRPNATKQAQHEQNLQSGAYNNGPYRILRIVYN